MTDTPAVIDGERVLDRAAFARLATRYAAVIKQRGIGPGATVAWIGPNSLEVVAVVEALKRAGVTAVPVNYHLTTAECSYILEDSDAEAVLFDIQQAEQLAPIVGTTSVESWLAFGSSGDDVPSWATDLDEAARSLGDSTTTETSESPGNGGMMIYTSGTTGRPKGAVREAGSSSSPSGARALLDALDIRPGGSYLTTGPLYHSAPLAFMNLTMALRATVVVQRRFDPEQWLQLVEKHQITTTFSAPTPIRRVLDLPADVRDRYDLSSLDRLIANAAPWPFNLKRRWIEAFGDRALYEVYGATELGVVSVLRPEDQLRKPGSCGRPLPGVEIHLFTDTGAEISAPFEPGELFIGGDAVISRYHKDEQKYRSSTRYGCLSVGDIAYLDDQGYLYICDRKSDMIISGGVNVYPAEIEAALVTHPAVADVAVIGVPHPEWDEAPHAYVVRHEDDPVTPDQLVAHCRQLLAGPKVPRTFSWVEEIPRSASGKVLKRQLRDQYLVEVGTDPAQQR
jgi:acyl-CoA synthetase (AMP-forming)/AMP-acid ligase II